MNAMQVRVIGVILLSISVSLPGFLLNEKLVQRKKYLRFFSDLATRLPLSMVDGGENIFEILKRESVGRFRYLALIDSCLINDRQGLQRLFFEHSIANEDAREIADFFLGLGFGSSEQQKNHCEIFESRFNGMLKTAEQSAENNGKLYKIMSLSLGLIVFIILI